MLKDYRNCFVAFLCHKEISSFKYQKDFLLALVLLIGQPSGASRITWKDSDP